MKKISILLLVIAMVFLTACDSHTPYVIPDETGQSSNAEGPAMGTRENPFPIGVFGLYDALDSDVGYKIELAVLEVIRGDEAALMVANADPNAPKTSEDEEYMLVKFHVKALESNDDEPIEIRNYRFSFVSEQGVSYPTCQFIYNLDAEFQDMYAGGEQEGYVFNIIDKEDNPVVCYLEGTSQRIYFSAK